MIGLLQRVDTAQVAVDGTVIAGIRRGLLVLIGVEAADGRPEAERLLERLLGYRVFPDGDGRMNLSLRDIGGGARRSLEQGPRFPGMRRRRRAWSLRFKSTRHSPLPGRTYR